MKVRNAKLTTNRDNPGFSTGARTEAGKKRSSLNALRHGLTGDIVRLSARATISNAVRSVRAAVAARPET